MEAVGELLHGLIVLAEAHEVDAEFRAGAPELGIDLDGFAVILEGLVIAPVDHEEVGGGGIAEAGVGIPGSLSLAVEPVDGGEDGLADDGIGVDGQGFAGFGGGFGIVVVFEREAREQFLGFEKLGVGLDGLTR